MFVEVVRGFMVMLGTAAGFWVGRDLGVPVGVESVGGVLGCLVGYVGGGLLGRLLERAVGAVEHRVERLPPAAFLAGALGALGGALAGATLAVPLVVVAPARVALPLGGLLIWVTAWAGFRIVGHQSATLFELLGLSTRPLVRAQAFDARDGLVVDSSVLMDGQLLTLARSGLLGGDLLVPRFVLDEVQGFADATDETRRRRARRGLETLEVLQREGPVRVFVLDDEVPEHDAVDTKLVALTKRLQLRLLTNDQPLARIADVQGVPTCNIRRLALDLSPAVVAGDFVRVALTRQGREQGQGVGHLDDGSMVVVNGGADLVGGPDVQLQVRSVVPTAAGRMVFASLDAT
ncbi:MAG: hypothetical protein QOI55_2042 [Actinomycetota bacterium]|nr:hypothetical protein [Actinomycetota bacterium]